MDALFEYGIFEMYIPIVWTNGIVKGVEPLTNYFEKDLKGKTTIIYTF